jgi:hypothetical protein
MNVELATKAFLWCAAINYGILIVWFLLFAFPHQWFYRLVGKWYRVTAEQFDTLNLALMSLYKVGILLFNIVPYIALRIVG